MPSATAASILAARLGSRISLSAADMAAVSALPASAQAVTRGSYLAREGEPSRHCCVLIDGFAARHKASGEGARQIVALAIPGDPVDLQNMFLDCADHNLQALTPSTVGLIPIEPLLEVMTASAAVAHAVLIDTLVDAAIYREWLLNVGRRDARARLAHLLCEFAVRMDRQGQRQPGGYAFPMRQEEIGDALGLTSIHVNRSIRAFEKEGLIARENRSIRFPGIAALREIAGFDPLYLHLATAA